MSKSRQTTKPSVESSFKERPRRARPMKVVVNGKGNPWICDCEADPSKDLAEQGCWQFTEEASTQGKEGRSSQKSTKFF
jgi:hypothetical protein